MPPRSTNKNNRWPFHRLAAKWLTDVGLAQQSMAPLYYPHHAQALLQTASKTDSRRLFALLGRLNALNPYGYHTLSVKMQLEYLLIEYFRFFGKTNPNR